MAQFRTTADIVDAALRNSGEVTNGNSPYESEALGFINRVHFSLLAGGTIALGKDQTVEIDETWPWAKAKRPLILELQPAYTSGTVSLTQGSEAGTFSSAPSYSVAGWYLRISGREGTFRIASHSAASTSFELDGAYTGETGSGLTLSVFKLDYELIPDYIVIDSGNNKLYFQETAGTTLTATLTAGSYTPSALATEATTQLNSAGGAPTYTVTYSALTKKFTLASDRSGGAVFILVGSGDSSAHGTLGFDDENTTNAASITSTYILGGICRLIQPMKGYAGKLILGCDPESFTRDYPFSRIIEDNPDRFCILSESSGGIFTVRFNSYPQYKTRVEIEKVDIPRDLKDSSSSIPLVPRKHIDVLEDAATARIMFLKNDDRAPLYINLAQGTLKSMIAQHRGSQARTGENFGQTIPRRDHVRRRGPIFEDPY